MSIYKLIPYSTLNKNNFFFLPSTACTHPMKNYTDIQREPCPGRASIRALCSPLSTFQGILTEWKSNPEIKASTSRQLFLRHDTIRKNIILTLYVNL